MSVGLELRDLQVRRGPRTVVAGVSLTVRPGEIVALLGPNGAGKSSLVLALAGVLPVSGGSVLVDGADLTGRGPAKVRAAGVAAVPEGHRVLRDLTVRDNLRVAGDGLSRSALAAGCERVLELFAELRPKLGVAAGSLSGGEQQMVALGQALVRAPKILVVDELSLGLAPVVVSRLAGALAGLKERGAGILLIEQFAEVALGLADRAHVLDRGKLAFSGAPQTLREQPELLHTSYLRTA
ncbi:MAG: transporter ATP-binding protein [Conexibacter sp.]|jgi:branched-chain amino acid transport system ATP-binding protein|nr:transporter ATP-binding protein [Conexibacter sp.]